MDTDTPFLDTDSSNSSGDEEDEEEEWRRRPAGIDTGNELIKLCQNLIFTYDISLMDKMSYALIDSFKREALKCTNGRPVLSRLITNYYNKKEPFADPKQLKPVTNFIRGPKNLTVHWSEQYNKLVYIFGELHQKPTCYGNTSSDPAIMMDIEDYIEQLLKNTDRFIDFAFEITTMGRKKKEYVYDPNIVFLGYPLDKLFQKFKHCIATNTRHHTDCQLGRVHFIDVRTENFKELDKLSYCMFMLLDSELDIPKIGTTLDNQEFITILRSIDNSFDKINDDMTNTIDYFRFHIFLNPYNIVEMSKLESSRNTEDRMVADAIRQFTSFEIKRLITKFYQILKQNIGIILDFHDQLLAQGHTTHHLRLINKDVVDSFYNVSKCMADIVSISTDVYCIARLFKSFDLTQEPFQGATQGDQPSKAHNIIIYAGDAHSQRYRRFLITLGFIEVAKTGQSENGKNFDSCINMKNIPQPFFSMNSNKKKKVTKDYVYNYSHVYDDHNFL